MEMISPGQYSLIANSFSFAIAVMGAATVFLFLSRSQVAAPYRTAVTISGIVTMIALYHYVRICPRPGIGHTSVPQRSGKGRGQGASLQPHQGAARNAFERALTRMCRALTLDRW